MYLVDSLRSSLLNIFAHKLRSLLTLLAIIIGIFAVVVMFSSVSGIQKLITENMKQLGFDNSIYVFPSEGHQSSVSRRIGGRRRRFMYIPRQVKPLSVNDYITLRSEVEHLSIYATIETRTRIYFPDKQDNIRLTATNLDFFKTKTYPLKAGRYFNHFEEKTASRVAVIGFHAAEKYFKDSDPLGEIITVGENRYKIIGVLEDDLLNRTGMNFNAWQRRSDLSAVYIPLTTGAKYLKQDGAIDNIYIQSQSKETFSEMKNRTRQVLLTNHKMGHNFSFEDVGSLMVTITEEIEKHLNKWNLTLTTIASISLLVGGLGLFSTMLISINERMLEIGIRKSVGATSLDIFVHFIIESLILALIGALIGIAIAVTGIKIVSLVINFSFPIVMEGLLLGIGFALFIGLLSGFYPALKASETNPIAAIYYNE
jgi:putative ABC transport system permease protein